MPVKPLGFHYTTRMPTPPVTSRPKPPARRRRAAIALLLLLIVVAHLGVVEWLKQELQLIAPQDDEDGVISINLQDLARPAAPEVPARPADPAPPPAPDPVDPAPAPPVSETPVAAVPKDAVPEPAIAEPAPPGEAMTTDAVTASTGRESAAAEDDADAPATLAPQAPTPSLFERASPPPAATLAFNVTGVRNGRRVDGHGSMAWQPDGQRYTLKTEIGVLFFTLLSSRSRGDIGRLGVIPELYAEKRIGRSETNTHFHRERQQISFSASTTTVPVHGGEQDRGTWIWQLASLGRGDPDKFDAGLVFEMVVAGAKAADRWRIYVNGRDNIDLPDGPVSAWRLSVIPGPDSVERQFDLWLAPERDWYPVKLRHEDRNGNTLDMQLKQISRN